jgi:hypothetical protein
MLDTLRSIFLSSLDPSQHVKLFSSLTSTSTLSIVMNLVTWITWNCIAYMCLKSTDFCKIINSNMPMCALGVLFSVKSSIQNGWL